MLQHNKRPLTWHFKVLRCASCGSWRPWGGPAPPLAKGAAGCDFRLSSLMPYKSPARITKWRFTAVLSNPVLHCSCRLHAGAQGGNDAFYARMWPLPRSTSAPADPTRLRHWSINITFTDNSHYSHTITRSAFCLFTLLSSSKNSKLIHHSPILPNWFLFYFIHLKN